MFRGRLSYSQRVFGWNLIKSGQNALLIPKWALKSDPNWPKWDLLRKITEILTTSIRNWCYEVIDIACLWNFWGSQLFVFTPKVFLSVQEGFRALREPNFIHPVDLWILSSFRKHLGAGPLKRYFRIQPYNIMVFGDFWESNIAVFRLYLRHKRSVFALMTSAWRALSVRVRRNRPEVQTRSGNEDIHDCKKGFFFSKKNI